MSETDSAGVPWAGRHFEPNPSAADDGTAPPALRAAIEEFRLGRVDESAVVDALRTSRLLVPLIAERGDEGVGAHGQLVDKSQELALVRVAAPDGRVVQPAFLSVAAMTAWNPSARPVPVEAVRVALAAAAEGTDLVVLDPTSPTEFVVRRPALWALAQGEPWRPSSLDPAVARAVADSAAREPQVLSVRVEAGDPDARLKGPELVIELVLVPGLTREEVDGLVTRLSQRWAEDETLARDVDSMAVRLESAPPSSPEHPWSPGSAQASG